MLHLLQTADEEHLVKQSKYSAHSPLYFLRKSCRLRRNRYVERENLRNGELPKRGNKPGSPYIL
jgi:hypothetical protein